MEDLYPSMEVVLGLQKEPGGATVPTMVSGNDIWNRDEKPQLRAVEVG